MSDNWIRTFSLVVSDAQGKALTLSDFRVTFSIEWALVKFPRAATVKIYNLKPDTANQIQGGEFSSIQIIGGYQHNSGLLFSGKIRYSLSGRDNPTDTFVIIQAIDSHDAFSYATVNQSLAAGYSLTDLNTVLMKSFAPFGITEGDTAPLPETRFPRGRVFFGMARDGMDNLAAQCNGTWQFVNGQRELIADTPPEQQAVRLNSQSGLIGLPQQTIGAGVNVRCLINPTLRMGSLIQLDQTLIYRTSLPQNALLADAGDDAAPPLTEKTHNGIITVPEALTPPASLATDGVYQVKNLSCLGDTRGKPWYMDLLCFARGAADWVSPDALNKGA